MSILDIVRRHKPTGTGKSPLPATVEPGPRDHVAEALAIIATGKAWTAPDLDATDRMILARLDAEALDAQQRDPKGEGDS